MPPINSGDAEAYWAELVVQALDQAVWVFDLTAQRTVYANAAFKQLWGERIDTAAARGPLGWLDLLHPADRERARIEFDTGLDRGLQTEYRLLGDDGQDGWISVHARTVTSNRYDGHQLMVGISEDITERKRREVAQLEGELQLRAALAAASLDAWRYDPAKDELLLSRDARALFAVPSGARVGIGTVLSFVHPEDRAALDREWQSFLEGSQEVFDHGYRTLDRDGTVRWIETICTMHRAPDGRPQTVLGVSMDVTRYKQQEEELAHALHQKDMLLREVNHRVKNSLQFISTLLMVQATTVRDRKSRGLFDAAALRVHAVARVHERLYHLPRTGRIQLAGFLRELAGDLQDTGLFATPPEISTELADDIEVGMDAAISIGLIVNEALTNAAKHGRSSDGSYRIRLGLEHEPGGIVLTIADHGPGLKPRKSRGGIGIMIVETLAETLKARLEVRRKPGTQVRVSIPLPSAPAGGAVTPLL